MDKNSIKGKNIIVVGLGKSGLAAIQAMLALGAKVTAQDSKEESKLDSNMIKLLREKGVELFLNCEPKSFKEYQMMILSPGVSPELPFICQAKAEGVEIIGELEIAYRIGKGQYISITGTNGKTTTTTLVGEIFKEAKRKTYVVGNIGIAVISVALKAEESDWLVTETSSFQLETTKEFRPQVSAILNLTEDHLNRHHTMENYGLTKAKIFENQSEDQYLVINYDDKACFELSERCKAKIIPFSRKEELKLGAYLKDEVLVIANEEGEIIKLCRADELQIPGAHNIENALAAAAISYFAGVDKDSIINVLKSFTGVEHRLEYVATVDGVRFVNDSKGTNPDSSIRALEAMKGGTILIAGGYDKGAEYDGLIDAFQGKVRYMMLLGKTAEKIKETAEKKGFDNCVTCKDLGECVKKAFELAEEGDTVLLSPACASWDMYTCFEQRGEHFKECVRLLEE